MQARPHDFLVAMAICFLVNLFCYLAIKYVSATSFKVAGQAAWQGAGRRDVVPLAVKLSFAWRASVLRMRCGRRNVMRPPFSDRPAVWGLCVPRRLPEECVGGVGRHPAG